VQDSLFRCEASAQYEREAGWLGTLISWRQLVAQRGLFLAYLSRVAKVLKLLKCINREISPRCERVIKRLFSFEKYNLNSRGETPAAAGSAAFAAVFCRILVGAQRRLLAWLGPRTSGVSWFPFLGVGWYANADAVAVGKRRCFRFRLTLPFFSLPQSAAQVAAYFSATGDC